MIGIDVVTLVSNVSSVMNENHYNVIHKNLVAHVSHCWVTSSKSKIEGKAAACCDEPDMLLLSYQMSPTPIQVRV
jgi:hypothetical protein